MFEPSGASPDDIYCRNSSPSALGQQIDPRLAFLARAAAWLALVEYEAATLDEALEALTPAFYAITTSPCACDREMVERWERDYPPRPLRYRAGGVR